MATEKQIDEPPQRNQIYRTPHRRGQIHHPLHALKHGIFAEAPVVKGEDPTPSTPPRFLPRPLPPSHTRRASPRRNLINHTWFLGRFAKIESHMWNLRIEGSPTSTQYFFAPVYAFVFEQLGEC